jgi:hypothetical protein
VPVNDKNLLDTRALNRATLARQLLLDRADLPVLDAVAHRGLSVAGNRVVLVDGRVAATWNVEAGTVTVTPLRHFSRADRTTVAEQGRELASFLSDHDSHRVQIRPW